MQSGIGFRLMALEFRLRDLLRPPEKILREAGLEQGMTVLDVGCGPGGYSMAAARLAGPGGRVYAVDINPLAVRTVREAAAAAGQANITVYDGLAALPPDLRVDLVLLYDVLHDIPDKVRTMGELWKTLRPGGTLSVSDHHLEEKELLAHVTGGGKFSLAGKGRWAYGFRRLEAGGEKT